LIANFTAQTEVKHIIKIRMKKIAFVLVGALAIYGCGGEKAAEGTETTVDTEVVNNPATAESGEVVVDPSEAPSSHLRRMRMTSEQSFREKKLPTHSNSQILEKETLSLLTLREVADVLFHLTQELQFLQEEKV